MATTLEIFFDRYTSETLWRWPTHADSPPPAVLSGHQVAHILKPRINERSSQGHSSGGMTVSTALLAPRELVNTNLEVPVILKIAIGAEKIELLRREAAVYENCLPHLQGSVVPRCYGLYRGRAGARGQPTENMACMILEYCTVHETPSMDRGEFAQRMKLAVWSLHQAGIIHGKLTDPRNVLDLGRKQGIRIVDFSAALRHECPSAGTNRYLGGGCQEVAIVDRQLASFH
ncbi:hypothetical protein PQX77_006299 [Marasmius sp. AFHP31]|nr:hypothetical protein PQX77_006299 [Marasmius sp. AFHP31]